MPALAALIVRIIGCSYYNVIMCGLVDVGRLLLHFLLVPQRRDWMVFLLICYSYHHFFTNTTFKSGGGWVSPLVSMAM